MRRIEKTQWDRDVDRHGSMTRQVEYELWYRSDILEYNNNLSA